MVLQCIDTVGWVTGRASGLESYRTSSPRRLSGRLSDDPA